MGGYKADLEKVPTAWQLEAQRSASRAAAKLGLPKPVIRWMSYPRGLYGWTEYDETMHLKNIIFLNVDRLQQDLIEPVVFHEARHLWQDRRSQYMGKKEGEDDAINWSYRETGKMVDFMPGYLAEKMDWRL